MNEKKSNTNKSSHSQKNDSWNNVSQLKPQPPKASSSSSDDQNSGSSGSSNNNQGDNNRN